MLIRYRVGPRRVAVAGIYDLPQSDGSIVSHTVVDPAIRDHGDGTDLVAYWESNFDEKHLAVREGEAVTWFHVQQLTRKQRDHISEMTTFRKCTMAFRFGVTRIEGALIVDAATMAEEPLPEIKRNDYSGMGAAITESWMNEANLPSEWVVAVGLMVLKMSEASNPLSNGSGKGSGGGGK